MTHALTRWIPAVVAAASLLPAGGCGRTIVDWADEGESSTGRPGAPAGATSVRPDADADADADDGPEGPHDVGSSECGPGQIGCTDSLDVLIVVDNSATMAEAAAGEALGGRVPGSTLPVG